VQGRAWPIRLLGRFSSLRTAATLIAVLAVVIGVATYYERDHGQPAAQVMVYQSWWFALLFLLLALNIFGAAAVRYPWRRRQFGFVVVHTGLLTLMVGFWLGHGRLDGALFVPPDADATLIDLPSDQLTIVDGADSGARRLAISFQPLGYGTHPSLLGYVLGGFTPPAPGVVAVDRALCTPSADYDAGLHADAIGNSGGSPSIFAWLRQRWSTLTHPRAGVLVPADAPEVRIRRVALTARDDLGFGPAADGAPAIKAVLRGRTPMMPADSDEVIAEGWLSASGPTSLESGPAMVTLGITHAPTLVEDFLSRTAPTARALVVHHAGQRHRFAIDATQLPARFTVTPELTVEVERALERPRFDGHSLNNDDDAALDPMLIARIASGPEATRTVVALPVFAFYPAHSATLGAAGAPELTYEHPGLAGDGGAPQGVSAQVLLTPDGGAAVRWVSRSKGILGAERLAPGATHWRGTLVGGDGAPMRIDLVLDRLAHAEPLPQPRPMLPDRASEAARWIEVEVRRAGASGRAWLRRSSAMQDGGFASVRLSDGHEVLLAYQVARYDLAARHGVALRLERFDEGRDVGGGTRATYVSDVHVTWRDGRPAETRRIAMNEPLQVGGVTFFQTSFVPEAGPDGHPVPGRYRFSVLQAATDPGLVCKYVGSILLVGGIVLMYLLRPRRASAA